MGCFLVYDLLSFDCMVKKKAILKKIRKNFSKVKQIVPRVQILFYPHTKDFGVGVKLRNFLDIIPRVYNFIKFLRFAQLYKV